MNYTHQNTECKMQGKIKFECRRNICNVQFTSYLKRDDRAGQQWQWYDIWFTNEVGTFVFPSTFQV